MTEPTLTPRADLMQGYILAPEGATVGDAIRTADISIPQYRQSIITGGNKILTQFNPNERAGELRTEPPTLDACADALVAIKGRKDEVMGTLGSDLGETELELKSDPPRGERSFWLKRKRALQEKLGQVADEEVTPAELLQAFMREDIAIHAKAIPADIREALETMTRERVFQQNIGEVGAVSPGAAFPEPAEASLPGS